MKPWVRNILCLSLLIGLVVYFFVPLIPYRQGLWAHPADEHARIYQFAKYELPSKYEFYAYRHSNTGRNKLVFFVNLETRQYFIIFILREIEKLKFEDVIFSRESVKRGRKAVYHPDIADTHIHLETLVPAFLPNEDMSGRANVTIRDFDVHNNETLTTDDTDILVTRGIFDSLAFDRKKTHWLKSYTVPVLASNQRFDGALALINNKKTGDTIFAVGSVFEGKPFNYDEFLNIIKSIRFAPEPGGNWDFGPTTRKSYSWD